MEHERIAYFVRSSDGHVWHAVMLRAAGAFEELTACGRSPEEFPPSVCSTAARLAPHDKRCPVCEGEINGRR